MQCNRVYLSSLQPSWWSVKHAAASSMVLTTVMIEHYCYCHRLQNIMCIVNIIPVAVIPETGLGNIMYTRTRAAVAY